jgi:hypothetical protein
MLEDRPMKHPLALIPLTLATLVACGPDPKLVANGVHHMCDMRAVLERLEENPDDPEAMRELEEKRAFLKITIEHAKEGSRHKLEDAIKAKADETCPR